MTIITWLLERRALKAKVIWQLPTTTPLYPVWLLSWRSVLPHLRHRVGSTFTNKSEEYFVRRVLGMIRDDKEEQKSDDEDLGGWWWMQSRVHLWSEY